MRARIAYINYTKKLRIFNSLNFFCVVYHNIVNVNTSRVIALCFFLFISRHEPLIKTEKQWRVMTLVSMSYANPSCEESYSQYICTLSSHRSTFTCGHMPERACIGGQV